MRTLDYTRLIGSQAALSGPTFAQSAQARLTPELVALWGQDYLSRTRTAELLTVTLEAFSYLFDLTAQRCVAAYGIMSGRNDISRDHGRMAGFPKAEGKEYHRGHMIPHSGKGGTDINLFIQLGSVNIGRFRELERLAVATPGSFYFVRLAYAPQNDGQRPDFVEQCLLLPGPRLEQRSFPN